MKFRLRYQQQDLDLPEGEFMIGRSASCQLSLDDPMVSRNHARLRVTAEAVTLHDLGSRNGVRVNGDRVTGSRQLEHGDVMTVGSQKLTLLVKRPKNAVTQTAHRAAPTHHLNAFGVLGSLANKAVALGRGDEAERILAVHSGRIAGGARRGVPHPISSPVPRATRVSAATTGKAVWFDYIVGCTPSSAALSCRDRRQLYSVLRKVGTIDLKLLRSYVERLRANASSLSPAERFLLNRIEGLERIAALR
jgi:hypothetical protein